MRNGENISIIKADCNLNISYITSYHSCFLTSKNFVPQSKKSQQLK